MADDEQAGNGFRVESLLRAARHFADLSQRDLAAKAGVDRRVVSRVEAGLVAAPRVDTLLRLLAAADVRLVAVTGPGDPLEPRPYDDALDAGERHWPAHLQVREVRTWSDWWFSPFIADMRPLPPYTADWSRNTVWWHNRHGPS